LHVANKNAEDFPGNLGHRALWINSPNSLTFGFGNSVSVFDIAQAIHHAVTISLQIGKFPMPLTS